jgi:hypothetical protein
MPKRTIWLVTGVAIGAGSSLWAERRVRRTVRQATAKLQPDTLVVEVGRSARQVAESAGNRVRGAISSGRDEMERQEEELWAELAQRGLDTTAARGAGGSGDSPTDTHPGRSGATRGATRRGTRKRRLTNSASYLDN